MAEMTSRDVVALLERLAREDVAVWLDGGWGVDALLGRQTRPHGDVDIVIQQKNLETLRELLEADGYTDVPRDDTRPWNFVLGDRHGHEVDVHVVVFDDEGNGVYGPPEEGFSYPAASLLGIGRVEDRRVRCIAAEYLVRFHTGYPLRKRDLEDVAALCQAFGIEEPEEHRRARAQGTRRE